MRTHTHDSCEGYSMIEDIECRNCLINMDQQKSVMQFIALKHEQHAQSEGTSVSGQIARIGKSSSRTSSPGTRQSGSAQPGVLTRGQPAMSQAYLSRLGAMRMCICV